MAEDAGQAQAAEMLLKDAALLYEKDEEDCRRLLAAAAALYIKYRAWWWRREPFNVFRVLRSEDDERNLHSRFLAALLDHRKVPGEPRENLKDFLVTVAEYWERETDDAGHEVLKTIVEKSDFKSGSIRIERESNYIDILIVNDAEPKWAVAIENKIRAIDQPQQLWKYYNSLTEYRNRTMLYLTLDGHEPEKHSVYDKDCRDRVPEDRLCLISYRDTLPPWLKRCQERAYAESGLRESIGQYLSIVRELTSTYWTEEYMTELKALCIKGNNPRLIHDLAEALMGKKVDLLCDFLKDVENAVKKTIPDLKLLPKGRLKESSRDQVAKYVGEKSYEEIGLYWSLGEEDTGVYLGAQIADGVYVGIHCDKDERSDQYNSFKKMFENVRRQNVRWYLSKWGAWYKWVDSSIAPENFKQDKLRLLEWENIEFLCDDKRRQEFATAIAQELKEIWDTVRKNTPA